ncbi:MAG: AAA domain-containing protein [Cyclobacteriaceae bacterium]
MNQILQSYLRRLTNLTASNRSLLLLRLPADQFIDLHEFDFVNNKPSFSIIENLIARKSKIKLTTVADSRDANANKASLKIKRLSRLEKQVFEERGAKDLYIGWPFVRGKFSDGTLVRCPLLFFPVEIQQEEGHWQLSIRDDLSISFNKTFLLAYSFFNKIPLDDEFLEKVFEDSDTDSRVFRTSLYQLIKESPVEINFNQENFLDSLQTFDLFKKNDFVKETGEGMLKLFPEAVLGVFPQAGSYLVPDYLHLIENNEFQDVEDFFVSRSIDKDEYKSTGNSPYFHFLNKVKEEQTFTPYETDAYQENALNAVKRGNSVVVQGPPGTGKSQLICNLMADYMARGKKVLLVCQKRAALDVVYKRLKEKELADFVALVHDFKNDRKSIYEQINKQAERLYEYKMRNNSLDAIQLERNFLLASRKIEQLTEEIDDFKAALFNEEEAGASIKELYLTSNRHKPVINIKQEFRYFKINEIEPFIDKIRIYYAYFRKFDLNTHLWKNRISFDGFGLSELNTMRNYLREIPVYQQALKNITMDLIGTEIDFAEGERIYENHTKINELLHLLEDGKVYFYFRHIALNTTEGADVLWLSNIEKNIAACFTDERPETSLILEELGHFQQVFQNYQNSRGNIFSYLRWRLFSKDKALVKQTLAQNKLSQKKDDLARLERRIDNRLNLEHNLTKLKSQKWLTEIPYRYKTEEFTHWFEAQKKAVKAFNIFRSFRGFRSYFNLETINPEAFRNQITDLTNVLSEIPVKKQQWLVYFKEWRIESLLNDAVLAETMIKSLEDDFDALCDYDNLKLTLNTQEKEVIEKLLEDKASRREGELVALLQNSLRLAWIDYIESKYPLLRSVNSLRFDQMRRDLYQSVKEKQKESGQITLMKARELTYGDVEFNRLNNMVTYRDLLHQVTKKRRIWPIRKLVSNHADDLFKLIPCWMASPESVSAIFPMEQLFDLVIFDEASQCFAERGIPSMYRGKQVVIAGDSRQLSPYDLYQIRWEEEEDTEETALEIDSLLDLGAMHLMQVHLKGHYRSKSLELIDFSNRFFYDGNLQLLPDKDALNLRKPAIEYIKLDGKWENNINETEARKIAQIVCELLTYQPDKEIGVVTFNIKQQEHILDVLEEEAMQKMLIIPETLFVKNIENVQGDEKDIIIFSIAYAPDAKGHMRHQFGSLNALRGENRLNVAVTRAKEKIIVVSSILPQQLHVDDTKNEGPKLLKKYLEYAIEVSEGRFKPFVKHRKDKRSDWYLKNKLSKLRPEALNGLTLSEEMPFADITVKQKDNFTGLILTDDDLFYESISSKQSFVYVPKNLQKLNWRYRHVFSREWWHEPDKLRENMLAFFSSDVKQEDALEDETSPSDVQE